MLFRITTGRSDPTTIVGASTQALPGPASGRWGVAIAICCLMLHCCMHDNSSGQVKQKQHAATHQCAQDLSILDEG